MHDKNMLLMIVLESISYTLYQNHLNLRIKRAYQGLSRFNGICLVSGRNMCIKKPDIFRCICSSCDCDSLIFKAEIQFLGTVYCTVYM